MKVHLCRANRIVAFTAIYLLWGGSYLAIRSVVSVLPPMFAASLRYCLSGIILLAISLVFRSAPFANLRQAANCCLTGLVMIVAGYALVFWSSTRLQSWLVAVLVSTSSLWTYLGECWLLRSQRARPAVLIPLIAGLLAIPVVSASGLHQRGINSLPAAGAILVSSLAWSLGALALKHFQLPVCPFQTSGLQLVSAGSVLALLSWTLGDWNHLVFRELIGNTRIMMGMAYLVLGGSVVAFSAYHWLMRRESPTLVATFTYVNPIVAMALGLGLGREHVSGLQLGAAVAILVSVVQVWRMQARLPGSSTMLSESKENLVSQGA